MGPDHAHHLNPFEEKRKYSKDVMTKDCLRGFSKCVDLSQYNDIQNQVLKLPISSKTLSVKTWTPSSNIHIESSL